MNIPMSFIIRTGCVIIDEISMVSTVMLAKISERLSQIKGNKEPFGGLDMILVGDFLQLRPVGGSPLDADVVDISGRLKPSAFKLAGSSLFATFRLHTLKEQGPCGGRQRALRGSGAPEGLLRKETCN